MLERVSVRRTGDDRRDAAERRAGARRADQRRTIESIMENDRRDAERRSGEDLRADSRRIEVHRRAMADRRKTAFA